MSVTPDEGQTHWHGCERKYGHHACALAEIDWLRAELERVTRIAAEYRGTLQDVRANLHAMGKRPEHCHEMSVIDDALAQEPPARRLEPGEEAALVTARNASMRFVDEEPPA